MWINSETMLIALRDRNKSNYSNGIPNICVIYYHSHRRMTNFFERVSKSVIPTNFFPYKQASLLLLAALHNYYKPVDCPFKRAHGNVKFRVNTCYRQPNNRYTVLPNVFEANELSRR